MAAQEDYYEVLEVSPRASSETISAAYRSLMRRSHPDTAEPADRPAAEERAKRLNRARAVLSDASARAEYDRWRARDAYQAARASHATPERAAERAGTDPVPQPGPGPGRTATPAKSGWHGRSHITMLEWVAIAYLALLAIAIIGGIMTLPFWGWAASVLR